MAENGGKWRHSVALMDVSRIISCVQLPYTTMLISLYSPCTYCEINFSFSYYKFDKANHGVYGICTNCIVFIPSQLARVSLSLPVQWLM